VIKKLLTLLGILLLLGVGIVGAKTFVDRHREKELIPATPTETLDNETAKISEQTTEPEKPNFNKTKLSNTDPASLWVVVNKKRPLNPLKYAPGDLISVGNSQQMRSEAGAALALLINAAAKAGLSIQPLSGYRSYDKQVSVYNNEVNSYGQAVADTESARPGHSEHQTGLSVDIGGGGCGIEDCFGNTAEGKWVATNAHTYGFIVRYTAPKQAVTGYRAEPWHVRYVGTELSEEMHIQGASTLEEFFGLGAAPSY